MHLQTALEVVKLVQIVISLFSKVSFVVSVTMVVLGYTLDVEFIVNAQQSL